MATHRAQASPAQLLRRFALFSAVSIAAILLLVGAGLHAIYRTQLVDGARSNAIAVAHAILERERTVLVATVPDGRARIAVASDELGALDSRMRAFLAPFGIVKIKVYDSGMAIVYSTDAAIVGRVDASNARLGRVLERGEHDSRLVRKDKVADLGGHERFHADVVETYVPVRLPEGVIGSVEVYLDVTPAYESIGRAVGLSIAVLLAVLLAVFGGLFYLMRQGAVGLERVEARLRELAAHDGLTGLFNRRDIVARIDEEFRRMDRGRRQPTPGHGCGFAMVDIDHFKAINDRLGHPAGDEVLRQFSARLKAGLRPYDVVGRYGGEEFLAMLPNTDPAQSVAVAERVREAIAGVPFDIAGEPVAVTASFGVAWADGDDDDVGAVIRRADEALYRAKAAGRNRVEAALAPPP